MPTPDDSASRVDSIVRQAILVLRAAAGMAKRAVSWLAQLGSDLAALVTRGPRTINQRQRLADMTGTAGRSIAETYHTIDKETRGDIRDLAKLFTNASPATITEILNRPALFGQTASQWWNSQAADLRQKFVAAMRYGLLLGESVEQLTARVAGLMPMKQAQAETLIHTAAISATNEARLLSMTDTFDAVQWSAVLDPDTCIICMNLDGKRWSLPDFKPVDHDQAWPGSVAHMRCRCTQVGVNDGERITPERFGKWIARRSDAEVDELFGKGRAALWRAGKLSLPEMVDQRNRILTLKELKEKINND